MSQQMGRIDKNKDRQLILPTSSYKNKVLLTAQSFPDNKGASLPTMSPNGEASTPSHLSQKKSLQYSQGNQLPQCFFTAAVEHGHG